MLTLADCEDWRERLAKALGCATSLADISATIGTARAKADERDELAARVVRDAQVIVAILPTAAEVDDLCSGLENPKRPVKRQLEEVRTRLASLCRHVEGLE